MVWRLKPREFVQAISLHAQQIYNNLPVSFKKSNFAMQHISRCLAERTTFSAKAIL